MDVKLTSLLLSLVPFVAPATEVDLYRDYVEESIDKYEVVMTKCRARRDDPVSQADKEKLKALPEEAQSDVIYYLYNKALFECHQPGYAKLAAALIWYDNLKNGKKDYRGYRMVLEDESRFYFEAKAAFDGYPLSVRQAAMDIERLKHPFNVIDVHEAVVRPYTSVELHKD